MLIKRGVIETIGVQDDRLFFGMDDVEYSLRASLTGWKNLIAYDAVIYQLWTASLLHFQKCTATLNSEFPLVQTASFFHVFRIPLCHGRLTLSMNKMDG